METINYVLKILNCSEMLKILFGIEYNVFLTIRKILTDEVINIDIEELLELLNDLDNLYLQYH